MKINENELEEEEKERQSIIMRATAIVFKGILPKWTSLSKELRNAIKQKVWN